MFLKPSSGICSCKSSQWSRAYCTMRTVSFLSVSAIRLSFRCSYAGALHLLRKNICIMDELCYEFIIYAGVLHNDFGNINTYCVQCISPLRLLLLLEDYALTHCLFRMLGYTNAPIWRLNLLNRTLQQKHR